MKRAEFFKKSIGAVVATVVGSKLDFITPKRIPTGIGVMEQLQDKPGKDPKTFTLQMDGHTVTFIHNELYDMNCTMGQ